MLDARVTRPTPPLRSRRATSAYPRAILGAAGGLALLAFSSTPAAQVPLTPIAQIEQIIVGGTPKLEPVAAEVRVVRGQQIVSARAALPLFEDDEILTGPNVTVKIICLEEVVEEDKTVLMGPASQIRIRSRSSIFLMLGRILANVRGLFDVSTSRATLGSRGTEFEVRVSDDGATHLVVLEGIVDVQRGEEQAQWVRASRGLLQRALLTNLNATSTAYPVAQIPRPAAVGRLEEITIRQGEPGTRVRATSEDRVRGVVDWTTEAVLAGQPSYTAKRVIPHFESPDERARAYRQAKFGAVWRREPGSNETLGKIYSDWNEGAKAVEAFTREIGIDQARVQSSSFLASLGDALRMKGRLKEAEEQLTRAQRAEPENARALNGLGNVYFAQAAAAQDTGGLDSARELLEKCLTIYTETRSARDTSPMAWGVAWANQGEANLSLGDIARQQNQLDDAAARYREAGEGFTRALAKGDRRYVYAAVGLADAARRSGSVAMARGATAEAKRAYGQAEAEYRKTLGAHPDLSAAHLGLGDIALELGQSDVALDSYTRAAMARPSEPAPYLRLALVLSERSKTVTTPPAASQDAAQFAQRYLALEHPALRQGQRAALADKITRDVSTNATVAVPNLLKLSEQSAREALQRARLAIGQVTTRAERSGNGTVIDQSPRAGVSVSTGTAVSFVIATASGGTAPGSVERTVPRVEDLARIEAEQIIQREGFRVGRIETRESSKAPGTVLDQKPDARRRAPAGSPIDLVIAVRKAVEVPDLVGERRDRALRELRDDGLVLGNVTERASCEEAGRVLAQDPVEDTRVPAGSAVAIVIAGPGLRPVRVPRVIGLRLQDAEATLREQQLKLRKIERSTTDRARPDTILSQAPEPSTTIAPGCFVDVVVAVAVPKVTVPNFVGMTQAQALELLPRIVAGRSGLTLGSVVYRDIRAPAGTVVDQNPRPGAVVEAGTPVGLVIARPQAPPDDRVTVPNVQGMVRRQAEAVLNRLKLRLEVRVEYRRSGYKEGQVISQAPKPGERVPPGTVVQLVVATTIG